MAFYDKLVAELASHKIRVDGEGAVTILSQKGEKSVSVDEGIAYIKAHAAENAKMLMGMWTEVADLVMDIGTYLANEGVQKMFVSAVKDLTKESAKTPVLVDAGVHRKLCSAVLRDTHAYSQQTMLQVVEYRLTIDWVEHLIQYDLYRTELLKALSLGKDQLLAVKIAAVNPYQRNLDFSMGERAEPWSWYGPNIPKWRDGDNPVNQDDSLMEQNHAYRSQQGLEDYDKCKTGRYFTQAGDRTECLMQQNEHKNDTFMDHSNDGWEWENAGVDGPSSSQRTSVMGR